MDGRCVSGCLSNADCPADRTCKEGRCQDPCNANSSPCGLNAECRVSDHRAVCLCPNGCRGEPTKACRSFFCTRHEDCEAEQNCGNDGLCRNPCLQDKPCGTNAQCKAIDRRAQCSCPPGFHGNPLVSCKQGLLFCS